MSDNSAKRMVLKGLDLAGAPLVYGAARILRLLRRLTLARLPRSAAMLERVNIYPLIDHPYEPLFNLHRLNKPLDAPRDLPGLSLDLDAALRLVEELGYRDEIAALPRTGPPDGGFHYDNPFFLEGDADLLYALIRKHRPRRFVEIGCGWSSRLASQAFNRNQTETGWRTEHVCIDPYVAGDFEALGARHVRSPVESCDPGLFAALEAGDMLFVDSSHMIRPQGDVLFIFLEVLPRLKPGVLIHVHDIFTPFDYPDDLIRNHRVFWNEQYLLEALLSGGTRYETLVPLHALYRHRPDQVKTALPQLSRAADPIPSSFWLVRR